MSEFPDTVCVLRTPREFVASLPAVVGFTPRKSLVVAMVQRGQLLVTMRMDLDHDWEAIAQHVTGTVSNVEADAVLIAVCDDSDWRDYRFRIRALRQRLEANWVTVLDAVYVQGGRYWTYTGINLGPDGMAIHESDRALPMPDNETREALIDRYTLRPQDQPSAAAYTAAQAAFTGSPRECAERTWESLKSLASDVRESDVHERDVPRATVQVGCQDVRTRDLVLARLMTAEHQRQLLNELVDAAVTATPNLAPRVCGMAAAAMAALNASTVPASALIEHASDDSLAELVRRGISHGVHPKALRDVFTSALALVEAQLNDKEVTTDETDQCSGSSGKARLCDVPESNQASLQGTR